ncbi:MAG: hypothetical protein KO206_01505 [Methanomicrobiaceae archaeon]|uniref:Ubia prenyltransferase family protein n=1 Tax=hydrocarbon metagenome TaxID=938273 RepID=A0A0W8FJW6_9ZZZZ|nr:hypothetical protein [Methanomicrobiaceae archaeon]MDD5418952.1 hypothetical protein [Methanomicrobiaceae archaeon]
MQDLGLIFSLVMVSVSGAVMLHFGYEFLGGSIPFTHFIAAALIAFAAYAFDRGIENREDESRQAEFRRLLLAAAISSVIVSFMLFPNPALLIPFLIAYLYTKGIRGYRLKGGIGVKNAVVAFTWTLGVLIFLGVFTLPALLLCGFFFTKSFVNTVIYDVRDIARDRMAGIATLPVLLTAPQLRLFLLSINLTAHAAALLGYFAGFFMGIRIIAISTIHSTLYILLYCNKFSCMRDVMVDGEWILYAGYMIFLDCLL